MSKNYTLLFWPDKESFFLGYLKYADKENTNHKYYNFYPLQDVK